jgi:hypothetical protein
VLALLAGLLTPAAAADPDSYVWDGVGSALLDLRAVEYEAELVEACEPLLIDPTSFDADYAREVLHGGEEPIVAAGMRRARSEDPHSWLSWWACFRSDG